MELGSRIAFARSSRVPDDSEEVVEEEVEDVEVVVSVEGVFDVVGVEVGLGVD